MSAYKSVFNATGKLKGLDLVYLNNISFDYNIVDEIANQAREVNG